MTHMYYISCDRSELDKIGPGFLLYSSSNCTDSNMKVPEGVSDAVTEIQKVPVVVEQEVSSVEIDVTNLEYISYQLLLRLDFVPSIAQELVHSCQRSYQNTWLSCTHTQEGQLVHI